MERFMIRQSQSQAWIQHMFLEAHQKEFVFSKYLSSHANAYADLTKKNKQEQMILE